MVMKSTLSSALALAAGILLAGIAPGQAAEHVKIGVVRSMGGAPLYVAQDMGFYKDEGLDAELIWFDAAQPVAVAAASGDIDFGSTGMTAAFLNLAAQGTLKIIGAGTWERKGFQSIGFMVSNQAYAAGVHSLKDMAGHSVGLTQVGTPLHYNIALALEKSRRRSQNACASCRCNPIPTSPRRSKAARSMRRCRPRPTSIRWSRRARRSSSAGRATCIEGQSEATFANTKFANDHPETVKKFLAAFRKAEATWDAAFTDKDGKRADQPAAKKMMEIASQRLALPPDVLAKGIAYYDPQSRVALADVQRAIDWYYSQGMIKEKLDAGSLIDKRFAIIAQPAVTQ